MTLIPDQLRSTAELHPDVTAFVVAAAAAADGRGGGTLTAGEWHRTSSRLARGLVGLGARAGERVALLMTPEDGLSFVLAYTAVHKAGAVAVPVNVRLRPDEVAGILRHAEAAVVVRTESLTHLVDPSSAPSVRTVVSTGAASGGALSWDALLHDDDTDLQVAREPDDLAEILYTSGTTGRPKGVAVTHRNSAMKLRTRAPWTGDAWLHASPMFTFAGLIFVFQSMRMGMRTVYLPRFDAASWLELVESERPTSVFLVPAMAELLLAFPGVQSADLSSITMLSVGSAPVAPATLQRLQELAPNAMIANSYSMTEAGTAYCFLPKGELKRRPGSVGQPLPPAEIRVCDEAGVPLSAGEVGEIRVKPPGTTRQYYRDPEATAAVFDDGWLCTGDLGRFDEDGYLYVVGRLKDVIIRGGLNIYACDVEAVLYTHPQVREAAVVAAPHDVLGEDVAAFVVARGPVTAQQLVEHCRGALADYKVPRRVELVDELPRNATGKVVKAELRRRLESASVVAG